MSDQQGVFDNWQQAAQEIINKQQQKVQETKQPQNVQNDEQNQENIQKQKQKQEKQAKLTLKQKIAQFKLFNPENFSSKVQGISEQGKKTIKLGGAKVLKTNKEFIEFGKQIAEKICQGIPEFQTIDQQSINTFFEELILYLYDGMTHQNFFEINKKLKAIKGQRKAIQKKEQKQKQKKKTKKGEEEGIQSSIKNYQDRQAPKDDLFGGASLMNSKQQEQQRKKKGTENKTQKVEQKQKQQTKKQTPPPPPADDDDDFM